MSARPQFARRRFFTTSALGTLACAMLWSPSAHAQLVPGAAPAQSNGTAPVINQSGTTTDVTLGGSRTVIDWDRFDINNGDTANFIFANRSDIVLNRVGGASGSTINGDLNGMVGAGGPTGGNIWIYNSNGVVIGANARINTGGLLVTTAALDRATDSSAGGFLDGSSTRFGFTGASSDPGILVRNGAQINSYGGAIALVSTSVTTEAGSSIAAQDGGNVLYGAAAKYRISFRPTGADDLDLLSFEVAGGADGTASTANGGDVLSLQGATSGNRVFAAVVSKTNVFSRLLSTGTITATNAALDESGAIVLTTNHNIVNGAASAAAVANNGGADIGLGNNAASTLTAPAITMLASDSISSSAAMTAAGGTVDLTAENGVLWSNVQGIIAGTLTARSGASMQFTGSNAIDRIGGLTAGGDISLYSYGTSTEIAGDIVSPGKVSLNVSPASGSGVIRAAHAELSGEGSFNLDSGTTLDYVYAIGNDLTVNSNGDLNLALTGTANDLGNRVILNAASGAIRQTAGSGGVLIGNVAANARDGIDLAEDNLFTRIAANSTGGGAINLKGAGGFGIAGSTAGTMTVTSPGTVTAGGTLDIGRLDINAAAIDLNRSNLGTVNFGDLTTTIGGIAIATDSTVSFSGTVAAATGHDVSITSELGTINQTGGTIRGRQVHMKATAGSILQDSSAAITSTGMGTDSFVAGDDLILAGANNIGVWGLASGWGSGSDVTLRSATRLYFDGGATPIGALTLIADNGNIQQGNIAFTANSLTASATQGIDLGTSANNSIAHLGNIASSTGEVVLRVGANNPLAIDGTISSASRVVFSARGAVSGIGSFSTPQLFLDLSGGGTINVAGSTNLLQLGIGENTTVRADDSLTLSGMVAGNGRNVTLIADSGSITQTGGYSSGVLALTATAAGNIDLQSEYNGFTSFTGTSTGDGSIKLRGFGFDFAVDTGGEVAIRAAGDLRALGGLRAGSLAVTSDTGSIILAPTSYAVGRFKDLSAVGDIDINAGDNILLTGAVTAGTVSLTSAMSIDQSAGSVVTANRVNLNSGGYIILDGANAVSSYAVTAAGIAALYSTRDVAIEAGTTVGDWLTVNSTGSITLGGGIVNGALTLEAGGNVGQTGSVTAASVTGRAGGDFLLDQIGNRLPVLRAVSSGGNLVVSTFSALDVSGDVTAVGQLSLRADLDLTQSAGTITGNTVSLTGLTVEQSGSGRVVAGELNAYGSRIDLGGANRVTGIGALTTFGGGEIIFRNEGDIVFDQSRFVTSGGRGRLTLISDTGRITQVSAMDALRLTARAAQGITLTDALNTVDMITGLGSTSGDIAFTTSGLLNLNGDVAASGTVRLHSGGSIIQSLGSISAARLETSAMWATMLQSAGNNVARLGTMESRGSGDIRYTGAGSFDLDGDINAQNQTIEFASGDANAAIRQLSGTITAGQIALSGGSYTLTGTNQILSLGATDVRGLELNTTTDLDLLGLVRVAGDLKITADDVIQNAGRIDNSQGGTLSISGRSIDLGSATNQLGKMGALSASGGNIALVSTGDVELTGAVNAGTGAFSLTAPGSITQTGGGITAGSLSASAGIDLLLGGANDVGTITLLGATDDLTIRNRGGVTLSALNLTGTLDVTSDTGAIIAANAVVAAELRASAANGAIAFTDSIGNRISRISGLTAGANATVQARNSGFTLTGDIDVGGTLTLRAGSGINQTGGRIRATTLEANLYQTMTTGSVLLGGANDVDNVYVLAASGGGNVVYRDIDGFNLTYAVVGNRVTLTADTGAITQSSGIMDGIQANELIVSAVDGISLNNEWNGVRTILGLTNTATGGINLVSRGGNMILGGNVAAAGQTVSLTTQNGSLSQSSGAITARRLDAAARTGITLTQAGNNISQLGTLTNSLSGGIAYTDANGFGITGNISAAGQSLTLGSLDATADFYQATTGSVITAGTLNINGGRYYLLRGVNGTGNAIGAIGDVNAKLSLNTSGAVDFRGNVVTDFLELSSAGDITQSSGRIENHSGGQLAFWGTNISLTSATNQLGRILQLRTWDSDFTGWFNVGTGDVTLVSTGDVAVAYVSAVNASLTSTGSIGTMSTGLAGLVNVERLGIDAGGTVSLGGAIRALANVTGRDEVFITSSADMALTGVINAGVGALALHSAGLLSQTGGSITAGSFGAQAGTGIDLGRTNFIGGLTGLSTTSGDISYRNRSGIMLPDVSAPGTLTLVSETGSITQGAGTGVTADTLVASAAGAIDLTGTNHIANLGALSAGNAIGVSTQDSLTLTGDIAAASVALTSGTGAITQAGGIVTAAAASLVAGGDVTLDRANAVGVYDARSGIGGTVTLRNAGDLVVKGITAQNGTVNLTSNSGSVGQQVVPGYAIWTRTFNANAATVIDLGQYNFVDTLGDLSAAGSIRFNNAGTIMLGGNIEAGGAFAMAVGGYIGQLTGTVTADHLDLTASGIALMSANDIGSTNASHLVASDDITFHSANAILLGSVSTPGLLSLTSDSGDIRQIAAFSAGRLEAMAAGDIVLDQLNTVNTVYDVTAGGVFSLRTAGALELDGRIAADDRVIFNTGGGLNQIGNTVIVTDRLEATAGAAITTGIRLLNHNRVGEISLNASGYDVRFRNTGDIAINAINAPTVELISNLGKITQQAAGGLVVGSLVLNAGNGVELYNADNQIARLDVVSRGNVSILTGGSGFGGLLTIDRIDAAGHSVGLSNSVNGITGGNITANRLNVFAVNNIDLGAGNDISGTVGLSSRDITFTNTGDLILTGLVGSNGNAVLRSEQGAIGMTNGAVFATDGLTAYGRDGVVLGGGIRRIDGLSAGPGADVFVASDYALDIAGDISARNVELLSNAQPGWYDPTGGKITQSGGVIAADRLIARALGDVTLDRSNQIAALGWTVSTTGNVKVISTGAMDLTDAISAVNGSVDLEADAISQSGGYIETAVLRARAAGSLSLDRENQITPAGTIDLSAGQDIAFRNSGSFTVGTIAVPGTLRLASTNGSITQAIASSLSADMLTAVANGGIDLDQANSIGTLGALTAGGNITFRNGGDLVLGGDIVAGGHKVALASNTGAITQIAGTIAARDLSAAAGGAITLDGANNVVNLRDVTAGGDIVYRNAGALMLWDDVTAAGHDVTLSTDSGSLLQMLFTSGIITANRLNARAGGALNLNHANRVNELGDYAAGSGLAGFTNDGSFALTGDVSGDELALTALSGGISQISGTITTGSILASASESIALGGANQVAGAGPVRLSSSNGNVIFRALGDYTLDFGSAAGSFDVTSDNGSILQSGAITANRLNARAGDNIVLTGNNAVAAIGFLAGEDIAFTAAGDLLLTDDIEAGGAVRLVAASGFIRQDAGIVTADRFAGTAGGDVRLGGANRIAALGDLAVGGALWLENDAALAIDGAVSSTLGVTIQSRGLTIGATGTVTSAAAGDAITLASDGLFRNFGGANALSASNGRWLVYSQASGNAGASDPGNDFGGLAGKSFYGAAYDFEAGGFAAAPNAGNRFVYGYRPVLTVRPGDLVMTYNGQTPDVAAVITGLVNGDRAGDAWSGAALVSGAGRNAGNYGLTAALGTLASDMNYDFAFGTGTLRIDPRALNATLTANDRSYDGTTNATGVFGLAGLVAGDRVDATGTLAFDTRNAGAGKTVTASEIVLTGADAGNYIVNSTATDLADIFARALNANFTANDRIYDGTTGATGALAIEGVLAGDMVGVTGSYAFDNRNAGTGKTVTASGILLTGADAGNYVVNTTATDQADIAARALTATLTANDRIYDGTTGATGSLQLGGVIAGDAIGSSMTLTFDTRNAGTGKTVTASGIALTGADAGNYVVNTTATGLADIAARVLTATLTANDRIYDGTTGATGTLGLDGLVAGDAVDVASNALRFDDRNAGTAKTVRANGIALTGADAGNYVVNSSAIDLADIAARTLTATLTANDRVYDGTTGATGTLAIEGVLAGDTVGVAGDISFDSRNAGDRVATAANLALTGADAGNYVVVGPASDTATIARRAITGTVRADSRVYDGTASATGRIALDGAIAGDDLAATARYTFADANAGAGRTVMVSGLTFGGADAGNYTLTLDGAPVLADILRRSVSVTANDFDKIFGQPDPVLTYRITGGSLVANDGFTGGLTRASGEQAGAYAIGQGSLALSSNYDLTVTPGTLTIRVTHTGADVSDVLDMWKRRNYGFALDRDPSANLDGDGEGGGDR